MGGEKLTVLISALEHTSYCPRQCGLIHLEHVWDENLFTLKGSQAHERTDEPQVRSERGKIVVRGLPVWSDVHGLTGKCDTVEADQTIQNPMPPGTMRPVEYKSGKKSKTLHASIQAGAQALCLEEMFETTVTEIALFFFAHKERVIIPFDQDLRTRTLAMLAETRAMLVGDALPEPAADKRCRHCSLIDACQPFAVEKAAGARLGWLFHPRSEAELP